MDIRFLESLTAVVEQGSIAGAARVQNLTPAAVSQRIQALERVFNKELLIRVAHSAKPTEACLNLLPRSRMLIREAKLLQDDLDPAGVSGTVNIGAISTALTGVIPSALKRLASEYPNIKPKIIRGNSSELYNDFQDNLLDAVIIEMPPFEMPKSVDYKVLRREKLTLLSHTTIDEPINTFLEKQQYIRYDPESWGGMKAEQYIQDNDLQLDLLCDTTSLEAISVMIGSEMGVSLVPRWAAFNSHTSGLASKEIDDERYTRNIVLVTSRNSSKVTMVNKLKHCLINQ